MEDTELELKKLGERTFCVDGPFKVGVYILKEADGYSEVCLIDTGVDEESAREIDEALAASQFRVSLILNTHYHADHSGGNRYFIEKYGCKAYSQKINAAMISNYDICPSVVWGGNPVKEVLNNYFYAPPCEAYDISELEMPEGLSIIEIPGHCIEMFAVKTADEVYFLGDGVVSVDTLKGHKLIYVYDIDKQLESLELMKGLKGKVFVPYHGGITEDISKLAEANISVMKENIELILDICTTPKCLDDIISEVFDRYGYKLTMYKYAVEGGVIRAYVTYLYNKGELVAVKEDNYIRWKKA